MRPSLSSGVNFRDRTDRKLMHGTHLGASLPEHSSRCCGICRPGPVYPGMMTLMFIRASAEQCLDVQGDGVHQGVSCVQHGVLTVPGVPLTVQHPIVVKNVQLVSVHCRPSCRASGQPLLHRDGRRYPTHGLRGTRAPRSVVRTPAAVQPRTQ